LQQVNYYLLTILSCGCSAQVKIDFHLSSFTITLKQGQDTMQLISLMVFRTDTWKRMVIRAIIISLVSGAAPAGRIQEDTSLMRFQKRSRLETAVKYAQNRKDTLMTYLEDGHCSFSNNLCENVIRPFTVGRKNWLFSATPKGAAASALVYTMVDMAKANELNIYKYPTYLLEHRPSEDMLDEQLRL